MKRARKILFWSAAAAAGLGMLFGTAGWLVVRTEWFREKVRRRIVRELETATGGRIELAAFRFDRRTLRTRVEGLVIHGTEASDQAPLFRAASIELELKTISLLKGAVDLRALLVERPEIHLVVYPDGRTNLPSPKPPRPLRKGVVEQILDLAVDRLTLDNGLLRFADHRIPISAQGEKFRARWLFDFGARRYRGSVSFTSLAVSLSQMSTVPLEFEADLALEQNRLRILNARLGCHDSQAVVEGALEDFTAPRLSLAYRASLKLSRLVPALGLRQAPRRGEADLKGRFEWRPGAYRAAGGLRASGVALEYGGARLEGISLTTDFLIEPQQAAFHNVRAWALGGKFVGRVRLEDWRNLQLQGEVRDLPLEQLAGRLGRSTSLFAGRISGPVRVGGRLQGTALSDLIAGARFEIVPAEGDNSLSGTVELDFQQSSGALRFAPSFVATRHSRLAFRGVLGETMEVDFQTSEPADIERLRAWIGPPVSERLPVGLRGGELAFRGTVRGPLKSPRLQGRLRAHFFQLEGRRFEALEAEVQASPSEARADQVQLRAGGARVSGTGRLALENWRPAAFGRLDAAFTVEVGDVASLLEWLGQERSACGEATAVVKVTGVWSDPQVQARILLRDARLYDQPFERLEAELRHGAGRLEAGAAEARIQGSRVRFSCEYAYRPGRLRQGRLKFRVAAAGVPLTGLPALAQAFAGWEAGIRADLVGEADLGPERPRLRALEGRAALEKVMLDGKPLGGLAVTASTAGDALALAVKGKLAGATVEGDSRWKLEGDYPGTGIVSFTRMQLSNLLARLGAPAAPARERSLPFEAFMEGKLHFQGAALDRNSWKATLELPTFELRPSAGAAVGNGSALALRNQGPLMIELDRKEARVRQVRLAGKDTELTLSGTFLFGSRYPFNLRLQGGLNLTLLAELDPDLRAAGQAALDATLRGSLLRPDFYGRMELRDASLNYADFPNGLDKLNGVVFLYRDRATIEKLTAESGGGKVRLEGFLNFSDPVSYWLQVKASGVRVRYPEGVSSTADVALALTGTGDRSVLSGDLTVTRAAFHPRTDLGSVLVRSAQTTQAPPTHTFLEGMRLDVRIRTAPQVRLETSLTRSIQAEADLRLRGTPLRPVLLGRALISQGEVLFFGNQYTIDSGEILFVDPSRIEPVVNLNVQTRARGVEVTLNINGPLNKTAVTYRSDPPLPFSDIVALLATGRAPSSAPGLAGARSEFAQSWEQAGASALVSQAIASPLAGRLQRFLGVSRLKIDPTVRGIENTPEAHLTLEQQITPDVTLIYITNLARAQQQTIRLEWDFTRNWSALAVREANGLFGVDFLYKKRFK